MSVTVKRKTGTLGMGGEILSESEWRKSQKNCS